MENKRLLFVSSCSSQFWAGCEHLWSETCLEMSVMGHTVGACHFPRESYQTLDAKLLRQGIQLFHHQPEIMVKSFFRKHHQLHFEHVLQQFRPDLVIISEGQQFESHFFMNTCREHRIPYAVVTHATPQFEWQGPYQDYYYRKLYESAVRTFFVSESNLRHFKIKIQSHLNNAQIIRNPFNVLYEQEFQWPDDHLLRLGMVGSAVVNRKGQDLIFEIFGQEKWRKRKVRVTMYTNGNIGEIHRLDRMKAFSRAANVDIVGYPDNVAAIWKQNHLLLVPSRREGLPITIVEAMLCGRPCLVTDVDGNPELLEDGVTGFVCHGFTFQELDKSMERMFCEKERLRAMGQAAFESIRKIIPPNPVRDFANILKNLK